jgi:two-component system, LytTR family, response regulator
VRVVIADDEPLARERVRSLLGRHPDVTVVAECRDGRHAVAALADPAVDTAFLDIQMPRLDGFEVLAELGRLPAVVFVTAYDQHAVRAFDAHAVDYLLKPIDTERFAVAMDRVRARLASRAVTDAAVDVGGPAVDHLVVRDGARIQRIPIDRIDWLDVTGNYARLHVAGAEHWLRTTLHSLVSRLDPARFVRIHRRVLVHKHRIDALEIGRHGDSIVILRDGTRLRASRAHTPHLRALLRGR